jgi:hypothetical protein
MSGVTEEEEEVLADSARGGRDGRLLPWERTNPVDDRERLRAQPAIANRGGKRIFYLGERCEENEGEDEVRGEIA